MRQEHRAEDNQRHVEISDMDDANFPIIQDGDLSNANMSFEDQETSQAMETEYFPNAAKVYGRGKHLFEKMRLQQRRNSSGSTNVFFPFSCMTDWEVADWLCRSHMSKAKASEFFHLSYVCFLIIADDYI